MARHCHELMLSRFVPPCKRGRHYTADCSQMSRKSANIVAFGSRQNCI